MLRPSFEPSEVRALADDSGWEFAGQIDDDPEQGIFFEVRWDTANGGTVHYIVGDVVDAAYLVARHDDPVIVEQVADHIAAGLPIWQPDELLEACYVKIYPAGWAKALKQLGLGAPKQADEQIVEHIGYSSRHADAPVRLAAVWAMVYTEWPVFRDVLAGMAETDADPDVAAQAAKAVREFDRVASSAT